CGAVVMEPIGWCWINELARIVSARDHRCADNIGKVPDLQHGARRWIHFNVHRVVVCSGIRIQDNPSFANVDVMVEVNNSNVAVISKVCNHAIKVDSIQYAANTQIGCIIKEDGTTGRDAACAYPPYCTVRIDDGRFESAATALNHDVIVA